MRAKYSQKFVATNKFSMDFLSQCLLLCNYCLSCCRIGKIHVHYIRLEKNENFSFGLGNFRVKYCVGFVYLYVYEFRLRRFLQNIDSILIEIPNSISAPGISELQQHVSSFPLSNTMRNAGESSEPCSTLAKVSSSIFPQSPSSAFSRASVKRCSLTKRLKGIRNSEVRTTTYN